ncbi:transcriptional regulator, CopG family [Archaeoglobus sulfaticallidus PM70-1]|uniref:Putative nickel-responsive regulator n=1 Tax=Archaeoglobus sulfaticallidus PM70-1 TaxID=387631 RepID=N0BMZ4_9EURY|nr:nickel-responsive transcriptional regulator NikR [Archaeoglobus sulfaticallidus]AGK61655.1 transcriptional regulator, CopG family [Archaeoglobus sulfaticallidus PM70-1]
MDEAIVRIGVSLPKNLLAEFDSIIRSRGYSSRSEAIRDAIRMYINEYKWLEKESGEVIGVVSVIYDHKYRGVTDTIISLQHDFGDVVTTTMHIHIDEENCLEMITVKGDMSKIKKMVGRLSALRGVTSVKFITAFKEEKF